jgi:hypothetical protein
MEEINSKYISGWIMIKLREKKKRSKLLIISQTYFPIWREVPAQVFLPEVSSSLS